jgi:hypothetical protein
MRFQQRLPRRALLALIPVSALFVLTGWYQDGCQGSDPDVPASCDPGAGEACASVAACKQRKDGLKNTYEIWLMDAPGGFNAVLVAKRRVITSWGYRTNALGCYPYHLIRWRHSQPVFEHHTPIGQTWDAGQWWHTSTCYDGGTQCLTRLSVRTGFSAEILGQQINFYNNGCIATRIGPGGGHHRVIHKHQLCEWIAAGSAQLAASSKSAERRADRANWFLDEFLAPRDAKRLRESCGNPVAYTDPGPAAELAVEITAYCRRALKRAWQTLSPAEQERAARLMADTRRKHGR